MSHVSAPPAGGASAKFNDTSLCREPQFISLPGSFVSRARRGGAVMRDPTASGTRERDRLTLRECEKLFIDNVSMGSAEAVRSARNHLQGAVLYELHAQASGIVDGHDLVGVALNHECRHVDFLEVFRLVGFGKSLDAVVGADDRGLHPLKPKRFANSLGNVGAGLVVPVEGKTQVLEKLRSVFAHTLADIVEHRQR